MYLSSSFLASSPPSRKLFLWTVPFLSFSILLSPTTFESVAQFKTDLNIPSLSSPLKPDKVVDNGKSDYGLPKGIPAL